MKKEIQVAIIGAGLIGRKRALALPEGMKLKIICDVNQDLGIKFSQEFDCTYTNDINQILNDQEIKAVFVATPNGYLTPIGKQIISSGKHVLIEKPGGLSSADIRSLKKEYEKQRVVVMFGYNHRFHPALFKTKEIIDSGAYGKVLFIRAKYGHGGRVGYEKEWRFVKELSGGGELIDQGSHLIDLVNFYTGEMSKIKSLTKTFFWKTSLEDSAFVLLENDKGQAANLSVSCVEWKNLFCFEVMLKTAKIQIDGLGGSYGTEKLTLYKMKPEMGPPDVEETEFKEPDSSWKKENQVFFDRIVKGEVNADSLDQAEYVLSTIERIYKENEGKS